MKKQISMKGIGKSFFETRALNNVDFSCKGGEVHALVGLNGAGKSTLMKVLGGIYQQDEGEIFIDGNNVKINQPSDANKLGISMIHQEYSLINELSIARNIFLGRELKFNHSPFLNKAKMSDLVAKELKRFGLDLNPNTIVSELNSGEKQIVEIIRSVMSNSWLIVMDEPTSALSEEDKKRLFTFIERMTDEGISIIYISHHMPEIFSISNEITVMQDGKVVLSEKITDTTEDAVIHAMTGKELESFVKPEKNINDHILLSLNNLSLGETYSNISFDVHKGEIVVLTGLRGCGGPELANAIFGLDSRYLGNIFYKNKKIKPGRGASNSIADGIGLVTENRDKNGIFSSLSVADNIALPFVNKCTKNGIVNSTLLDLRINKAIQKTSTKTASPEQEIRFLSGGNKQKICFSRWLDDGLELLILLEPTRGIDVHAKADIYRIIEELAEEGVGILILSYEIDEVLMLADRVITLYCGQEIAQYHYPHFEKGKMLSDMSGA